MYIAYEMIFFFNFPNHKLFLLMYITSSVTLYVTDYVIKTEHFYYIFIILIWKF